MITTRMMKKAVKITSPIFLATSFQLLPFFAMHPPEGDLRGAALRLPVIILISPLSDFAPYPCTGLFFRPSPFGLRPGFGGRRGA